MEKSKKAALYIRVSTMHQIDKDSLPFQRQELINYAKYALNIDNYEVFQDAGYSGKDTDRPAYQKMVQGIRDGKFTHLLVFKIDRISRNLLDFTAMYEELKKYNVIFVSKNEQFDTSSAMGEAMLKIILIFAELERKLTAERVRGVMLSRAEKGLWNGANAPLGYKYDAEVKFPVIDEDEAKIVSFIFNSYEKLKSTGDVRDMLVNDKIKTKRDGSWTTKTISDIIRNPFYMGTYRYNYRYTPHGKIRPADEWIVVEDNHKGIITKEQYDKCNAIMDSNVSGRGLTRTSHIHVFSRLIECKECKKNYIATVDRARADGYRPSAYRCHNYVHRQKDSRTCKGSVAEVKLGPFVMNYVANLVKADEVIKNKGQCISKKDLEKIILTGSMFDNVSGIIQEDLDYTYDLLLRSNRKMVFDKIEDETITRVDFKFESLVREKKKFDRAILRLEDLYLFSEESMAEKDYLVKKQEFSEKIKDINDQLNKRSLESSKGLKDLNLGFIKKSTQYLLAQNLSNDEEINYNEMVRIVDKELLKKFMQSIIQTITVEENKNVYSIEFTNGLKQRFVYRD